MKYKDSFHPYAALTILLWSLAYVLTRLALQQFSPFSLGFLRYGIASCTLLIAALGTKLQPPRRRDLPRFLAAGGVGFFFYMIAFNQGQATVTASTGSLVIATVPILTALLAHFVNRETLRPLQWGAILTAFAGVAILTLGEGSFSLQAGFVWLFLAAVALSLYNLMQRNLTKTYSPLQASTYSMFGGTLLLAIFAPTALQQATGAPAIHVLYLAILGIGSSAIAYVSWTTAFSKAAQTSQVSNYMFLTPLLTSLLGVLLAKEFPSPATLTGGGIILLGLLLFQVGGKKQRHGP